MSFPMLFPWTDEWAAFPTFMLSKDQRNITGSFASALPAVLWSPLGGAALALRSSFPRLTWALPARTELFPAGLSSPRWVSKGCASASHFVHCQELWLPRQDPFQGQGHGFIRKNFHSHKLLLFSTLHIWFSYIFIFAIRVLCSLWYKKGR